MEKNELYYFIIDRLTIQSNLTIDKKYNLKIYHTTGECKLNTCEADIVITNEKCIIEDYRKKIMRYFNCPVFAPRIMMQIYPAECLFHCNRFKIN